MATKKSTTRELPFYVALKRAGCVYCRRCRAFMYPDHTQHVTAGAFDTHTSRYKVVGSYGNVRLVDLHADAA